MSEVFDQIGPYTIDREIGRGGMGIVYLGHDTKLDRPVAIKSLPEDLAHDAQRLARFEREARTLAQLDHPNLAGIFGVEESDAGRFLILEYVEGETLADALERGPIAIDDALDLCAQIAAGVASAHDAGVIHRDLKPANIKITSEGKVKVLDFGLAKTTDAASSSSFSESPTLTTPAGPHSPTVPGAILGTAPYMSPEQARGRRVDKRSDVWSFGCILYECLTGARLFIGETATDSIGAILHKEIDLGLLPSETPMRVRELLGRMFERDKERRLRDLGDASLDLEAARGEVGAVSSLAGGAKSGPGWGGALAIAALTAVVTIAGLWSLARAPGKENETPRRPRIAMTQLTDRQGVEQWSSISPDGSTIVYESIDAGDSDIFTQRVGGFNATNLTPDSADEDYCPAFSPDGQFIAFRSDRSGGGIFIMGATGESPRRLTDFGFDPAWSPDGGRLALATEHIVDPLGRETVSALWVVDVASGETERIYEGDAVHPNWSPSGARIACWRYVQGGQRDLFTIGADGTGFVEVTDDAPTDWNPVWSPDGKWLYFCSDRGGSFAIWRIAIDESTGAVLGEPEQITTATSAGAGHLSFSRDGRRLAFTSSRVGISLQRLDLDPSTGEPSGAPRTLTPFTTGAGMPAISPDGRFVAYYNSGERQEDLFIISSDGAGRRRVTNDAAKDRGPKWTSDGSRLVFYSDRNGEYRGWTIRIDGGGLELLVEDKGGLNELVLSPDGRFLAWGNVKTGGLLRLGPGEEDRTPESLPPHPDGLAPCWPFDWSSDSSKLLVSWGDDEQANAILTILDIETGDYELIGPSPKLGDAAFFSDDRFVLASLGRDFVKIDIESGEMRMIYTDTRDILGSSELDLAPDDSWFCYNLIEIESDIWMIEFEEE